MVDQFLVLGIGTLRDKKNQLSSCRLLDVIQLQSPNRHLQRLVISNLNMWVFPQIGVGPPNHPFVHRVFHYKPSILGYHYFWKHPCGEVLRICEDDPI